MGLLDSLCSHVECVPGVSMFRNAEDIIERKLWRENLQRGKILQKPAAPPNLQLSRTVCVVEKSHQTQRNILYSIQLCAAQPALQNSSLSESSWDGSVRYKSSNGWEFLYGWATPNKTHEAVCFYSMLAGAFFVPGTPCEVNGLMHGPWIRDLFTLIHLSLKPLQERIKAEVQDGTEGALSICKIMQDTVYDQVRLL